MLLLENIGIYKHISFLDLIIHLSYLFYLSLVAIMDDYPFKILTTLVRMVFAMPLFIHLDIVSLL